MQIVVNNILVSYKDQGKGPVLLAVHGWMHNLSSYKQLTDELQGSYRVISLDLPNFGASQITEDIQSIDDYAKFIEAFTKKLKLSTYTLIGHSMGGQIAIWGTARHILKPKQLILIGAAGIRDNRKLYKLFLLMVSKVLRHIVPKNLKSKFYAKIGSDYDPNLSEVHKKIITKTLTTDIQDEAPNITIPTLLLYGRNDTFTPPWMGERLASLIPNARMITIENEQHWPHQTSAREVAMCIKEFLV